MTTMSILTGKPAPEPAAVMPWDIGTPQNLKSALTTARFNNVTCTEYDHPVQFELPDLIKLVAGPDGQFAPMLDKMKASGRTGIYQEAAEVQL